MIKNMKNIRILSHRNYYKPFDYPIFFDIWKLQQDMFWLPHMISLEKDRLQFTNYLTQSEQAIIINLLRFFTQTEIEISQGYYKLLNVFKLFEIQSMIAAFINMESIHAAAYAQLVDQLELPDETFKSFMQFKVMTDKQNEITFVNTDTNINLLHTIACISVFTEGFVLFSSFCLLLNLSRFGYLKNVAQIASYSLRDETLHCFAMTKLYNTFKNEMLQNKQLTTQELKKLENMILDKYCTLMNLEEQFIRLLFNDGMHTMRGITEQNIISYIRRLGAMRIQDIGIQCPTQYRHDETHYPDWIDAMTNATEFIDFFATRGTEYKKTDMSSIDESSFQ